MQALAKPRHELFAQQLAEGKTAHAAYENAGYKRDRHHAARLATKGHIRARVAFLQAQASQGALVTLERLLAEAEAARTLAMRLGQASAAVSAVREKGVLSGLRVERSERMTGNVNDISDDELVRIARGEAQTVELDSVDWSTKTAIGRKN
jgi:hypothetical protein